MKTTLNFSKNNTYNWSFEKFIELTKILNAKEAQKLDHGELEVLIATEGREVMRRLLQEHIEARGDGNVGMSLLGSDGAKRKIKKNRCRGLTSIFGKIDINRLGYSSENINSLFPKDADLNLTEDTYSFGIRELVGIEVSKTSFEEAIESIRHSTGLTIPKRQAKILATKAAQDFDLFYGEKRKKNKKASGSQCPLLILTVDGKGIVMRKEDLKELTRKKAEKSKHKLAKRVSKGEKRNAKRMATVASVYDIDRYKRRPEDISKEFAPVKIVKKNVRPKPVNKRVWASIEKTSKVVTDKIFEEAIKRDPKKIKEWVCLVDGDPNQINRVKHSARKYKAEITIVVDIIHVIEYLWKAVRVFYKESDPNAEKWVGERLLKILKGEASNVAAGMTRSATLKKLKRETREPVDTCAGYLLKKSKYLRYNEYLKKGFPIATGVIEGACRHLIKDRMDVTGARWSLQGAEAVLKLRSLRISGDFVDYWTFHKEQEYIRNHKLCYAQPLVLK